MKAFGNQLREAREVAGYRSAERFALALGIEAPAYRRYERGESSPNLETLTRMCLMLNTTPNDLLPLALSSAIEIEQTTKAVAS